MRWPAEQVVLVERDHDGALRIASPGVGIYHDAPRTGEILVGGSRAGLLTRLGNEMALVMPPDATGRVAERLLRHRAEPVQYGQTLLRLAPVEAAGDTATSLVEALQGHDLPAGAFAVTSPTHGIFYHRPRPDEPPYTEPGAVVEEGATLGLVEVMKCFSAITYRGEGFPRRARVLEFRAGDGSEVQADQVLVVMERA